MGKLMRSRGKSTNINADATSYSPILGTHQHDQQKLYKKIQN